MSVINSILKFFSTPLRLGLGIAALLLLGILLGKYFPLIKTTHTLKPTTLGVEEIKDIGQLISAEYYGEIVHSLSEGFQSSDDSLFKYFYNKMSSSAQVIFSHHESEVPNAAQNADKVWERVYDYFREFSSERVNPVYLHLMRLNHPEFRDLRRRKKRAELALLKEISQKSWEEFISGKEGQLREEIRNFRREKLSEIEIYYLCRGWVKAGYDLTALKQGSISISEDSMFQIRGLDPYILCADINPWFIPPHGEFNEGMPGYQLLRATIGTGRQKRDLEKVNFQDGTQAKSIPFHLIKRTKKSARIELIREAIQRDIFESAKSSAEESLFQLLLMLDPENRKGIKGVEILHGEDFTTLLSVLENSKELDFETLDAFQHYIHLE